ncbi:DUF5667 domain-containing protein [Embleya scabrispora]|uniref:DUF5667 domain-containing protein n=1 Tax=Embleya scabrispora TaxID=159449 RepID=UPI00035E8232|nr:DUF5667 domain-containing protein [Embleya scabrispora]MYS81313.1 hypothetical protein [Streptomyces sp. SID5474]
MSIAALDRRPANAFARALDENDRNNRSAEPLPALVPLLRTAELLRDRSESAPVPSVDFRAALRQRLLDEAAALPATEGTATVPAPRGAHRRKELATPPRTVRWRRRAAIAGAFVVATGGGLGGVAYASSDALPGDMTYGVKRTVEDFKISLADNDHERGERYLQQAETRMSEAEQLLKRAGRTPTDKATVRHLRQVLDDWRDEADKGRELLTDHFRKSGSDGPMRNLADFARSGHERMDRIGDRLPPELSSERDRVRTLLTAINEQVAPIAGTADKASSTPSERGRTGGSPAAPGANPGDAPGTGPQPLAPHPPGPGGTAANGAPQPNGSAPTGDAAPRQQSQQDGGLLPGLNIPLLGDAPAQSPTAQSGGADTAPTPAKTPKGQILPPLLPGLPGIGLNLLGPAEEDPPG